MILELVLCVPLLVAAVLLLKSDPHPRCDVYSQPGKFFYLKKFLFNLLFLLRQRHQLNCSNNSNQADVGYGKKSRISLKEMEGEQTISGQYGIDTIYINGSDEDGTFFVMRIARRINRLAEIWLSINIPGIGFFQSPIHPDTRVYNTDNHSFSAGGLKFECLEPMRRWKVLYNGLLRKGLFNKYTSDEEYKTVYVSFSFIWEAVTEVFDFDSDIHAESLSAAVAREKWNTQFFINLRKSHQTHYEQWGELKGIVQVEGQPELHLTLKSLRDHSYGVRDWRLFHRYIVHFGWIEDGTFFHVNTISMPTSLSYLQCGYVSYPNGEMHPVYYTNIQLEDLGEDGTPPKKYSFTFKAGFRSYNATVCVGDTPEYRHHNDWGSVIHEGLCTYQINGLKGYGISEFCYRDKNAVNPVASEESVRLLQQPDDIPAGDEHALCLPFTSTSCQLSSLVGGKGCQLALLTSLESNLFIVPSGFCVTIAAFKSHLEEHEELQNKVSQLAQIASGEMKADLPSYCEEVVSSFCLTPIHNKLRSQIQRQLLAIFGEQYDQLTFAVRSSAAGEDSEELSAAGQMDTVLGVKGLDSVCVAVQRCWSSHFALTAVEYRRQNGQAVVSRMAIVVQQMASADAAGVLFTVDPMTGNPSHMIINASYGLGESVVSGVSEPDNIVVNRTWDNRLTVADKQISSKEVQLRVQDDGGIVEEAVTSQQVNLCCISDDVILRLAHIGVQLEKHFSDPRDIEFAVSNDQIYLLQARPITTLNQESNFELLHEFDTPLAMNTELLTTGNISEMMPGAVTPLTASVFGRAIEWSLQEYNRKVGCNDKTKNISKSVGLCCNHLFINMHFVAGTNQERILGNSFEMAELALMGEVVEGLTLEGIRNYHGSFSPIKRVVNAVKNFRQMNLSYTLTKNWESFLDSYRLGEQCSTAQQLYDAIHTDLHIYYKVFSASNCNSARSSSWAFVVMSILTAGTSDWKTEHYSDVALLLSKCDDVYSADVPSALQIMAEVIVQCKQSEPFVKMSPQDAVIWLESSENVVVHRKYSEFMKRHGHRCVRESEFREKSWQSQPTTLVTVLQSLVKAAMVTDSRQKRQEKVDDVNEAINKMKTPLTPVGRFILKYIIPRARRAVGGREWGKSVSIKMVEAFKRAYWRLAEMMVLEGRLPDQDLLFFFTHQEIDKLLKTRSGGLIKKAQHRRRLLSKQMAMQFQKINFGHPKPIEEQEKTHFAITSVKIKGLPVSRGVVRGPARVVKSLQMASEIQPGDILIVSYTDVGWSPYFPLIAGLVTEIGGLVSHGAVVAREYGLPCVVNCSKATQLFNSGDQVILNGTEGIIQKIQEDTNEYA